MALARLVEPRIQLHHAINAVMSVGRAFVPPEPDFGHASFQWLSGDRARGLGPGVLAGRTVGADRAFRAALRLDRPAIVLIDASAATIAEHELHGRTLVEAFEWLSQRIHDQGLDPSALVLKLPRGMPQHRVGEGGPFAFDDVEACAELAAWYDGADALIREISVVEPRATDVRCWPHHFDLASLVKLTDRTDDDAPCVGVGLSPGDQLIAEPYVYVSPWPYPSAAALPAAPAGAHWRTQDWVGLYLTASDLLAGGPGELERLARAFLLEGLSVSTTVLKATPLRSGGR